MKKNSSRLKKIEGYNFNFICKIIPESSVGQIVKYSPKEEFSNHENLNLNPYGNGEFCKFRTPMIKKSGVYCLIENEEVVYKEDCLNLDQRFNAGYGIISPRNCFEMGQAVNCKINRLILESYKSNNTIKLYFIETSNRNRLKKSLQNILKPKWNEKNISFEKDQNTDSIEEFNDITTDEIKNECAKHGKYGKLYGYLKRKDLDKIEMSLVKIEEVLGDKLPKSAYSYQTWWANGGHHHALTWLDAGYRVKVISLGEKICFYKD